LKPRDISSQACLADRQKNKGFENEQYEKNSRSSFDSMGS